MKQADKLNILLFEDDEDDVLLFEECLQSVANFSVALTWERNPSQIEKHLKTPWDIIFVDGYLGAFHAVDLIPLLHQHKIKAPIVVLTGADNQELARAVLEAGAEDYVVKDRLTPPYIERIVRYNLQRFQQNLQAHQLNEELEHHVQLRTAELTRINFSLQESEQRAQLLKRIATTVHSDIDEQSFYYKTLELLCYFTGWSLGHVVFTEPQQSMPLPHRQVCFTMEPEASSTLCQVPPLHLSALQHDQSPVWKPFYLAQERVIYREIPSEESTRMQAATKLGFHSQLLFPLKLRQRVLCFFEFFCHYPLDNADSIISMLEEVQQQLTVALKRRMSEQARMLSERRLSQALRIGRMCSFTWDLEDDKLWFSPEVKTLFDTPIPLPKNRKDVKHIIHAEDLQRVSEAWLYALQTSSTYALDHRLVGHDGRIHYVGVQGEIECDVQTRKRRMIGSIQNINERKKSEFHLARLKEAAEAANTAKSTFLANMSHEIRTPLNAILGFTQILMRDKHLNPQHLAHIQMMNKSGEHLLGLINDILEMSKIESGRIQLKEESVDLHELLKDVHQLFLTQAQRKGLQLQLALNESIPPRVVLDKSKLKQILFNILSNALKFTTSGFICIRVFWQLGTLRFEIEDTGEGIAPEEMHLVFESFGQTQSGNKAQQGTGLGMPISKTYAQMMGGDLTLTSERHVGTIFHLKISASLSDETTPLASEHNHDKYQQVNYVYPLDTGAPRILIADDNIANQLFLQEALTALGFHTHTVNEGEAVIQAFQSWYPDLILMDVDMPGMNGLEAAKRIRTLSTGKHLPIVFITASAFSHEKQALMQAGANDILLKPLHLNTLLYTLETRLGLRYGFHEPTEEVEAPHSPEIDANLAPEDTKILMQYILEGDLDAFLEALHQQTLPTDLKARLLELADHYAFDSITELLRQQNKEGHHHAE